MNVSEPESLELTVSNLKPEESYSFRVVAYSEAGPGRSSAPLQIATKPDRKPPAGAVWSYIRANQIPHIILKFDPKVILKLKSVLTFFHFEKCFQAETETLVVFLPNVLYGAKLGP